MVLLIHEAGKTLDNAQADLREAVDFLRYYADAGARRIFSRRSGFPGPTGERNELSLHGRGILPASRRGTSRSPSSPARLRPHWQPATRSSPSRPSRRRLSPPRPSASASRRACRGMFCISCRAMARASEERCSPTGGWLVWRSPVPTKRRRSSTARWPPATARSLPFIAETGGMNAMIVDSSALPEQAVRDAIASAFDSAGQRCSAARILFVQDDIAERLIAMLKGAMAELKVGDPLDYTNRRGAGHRRGSKQHSTRIKRRWQGRARPSWTCGSTARTQAGTFVSPAAFEIGDLKLLDREVFGPDPARGPLCRRPAWPGVRALNATGYGLTLGLHTRIETTVEEVRARIRVGNMYVNRNQIGAVVGAQPFGGEGLSGTGPKAGGPHYLQRFATERVISVDTTASGGNAALMSHGARAELDGRAAVRCRRGGCRLRRRGSLHRAVRSRYRTSLFSKRSDRAGGRAFTRPFARRARYGVRRIVDCARTSTAYATIARGTRISFSGRYSRQSESGAGMMARYCAETSQWRRGESGIRCGNGSAFIADALAHALRTASNVEARPLQHESQRVFAAPHCKPRGARPNPRLVVHLGQWRSQHHFGSGVHFELCPRRWVARGHDVGIAPMR